MNQLLLGSGQIPPETDMLNFLTCSHEQRWPKIDCIDGKNLQIIYLKKYYFQSLC